MLTTSRTRSLALAAVLLASASCGTSTDSDSKAATSATTGTAMDSTTSTPKSKSTGNVPAMFAKGALTSDAETVDCTLENGTETICYRLTVASLPSTVKTDGPFCPATTNDSAGIWVWDGDNPGLYALDKNFWSMMTDQGYEFADASGTITTVDPAAGPPSSAGTKNSCLQASANGSFHLQVLLPTKPEKLDTPTDLSSVAQIGLATDGATIFGDAPSVAATGGLPALDACGGHIDPSGYYHWHFGAESIQANLDKAGAAVTCGVEQDPEALVGFAFDGYPIYAPEENRSIPTDLDACSGHTSDTDAFGETYHYHLTYDSPNLPKCRVGATATGKLTSPDNSSATLPDGGGAGGGPGAGPGGGPMGGPGPGGPPPQ